MSRKNPVSVELLWRLAGWQLRRDWGWLLGGVGAGLLVALWVIVKPFDLRHQRELVYLSAQLLAAWGFGWSLLYACAGWLAPHRQQLAGDGLALPFSRLQQLLNELMPSALVPFLTGLAGLVWFSVGVIYVGVPYDSGYNYSGELSTAVMWWVRICGLASNILAGPLLALAWGQAMAVLCAWRPLRVILALGAPVGLVLFMRHWEYDFFYMCYWQTRGYAPYVFIVIPALLILLPGALAWLWRPWRQAALSLVLLLLAVLVVLPFAQYQLPGAHTTALLRELLGDWRFGLACFAGHLDLWRNCFLIDGMFLSNVLLDDHAAGNLIPQHIPLWYGAVIYPLALPALVLLSLSLGKLWRPLRHCEE